jgi:hypothetical protein
LEEEMMKRSLGSTALLLAAGILAVSGLLVQPRAASAARHRAYLYAQLSGPSISGVKPIGESEFGTTGVGTKTKTILEVEFGSVNMPDGTVLTIKINNVQIGQASLRNHGSFAYFTTEKGAKLNPPKKGDKLTVSDPKGNVILTGTY